MKKKYAESIEYQSSWVVWEKYFEIDAFIDLFQQYLNTLQ